MTALFFVFTLAPACPGGPRGPDKPCDPFILTTNERNQETEILQNKILSSLLLRQTKKTKKLSRHALNAAVK